MQPLLDVFDNYLATKLEYFGKTTRNESVDQRSLLLGLPQLFEKFLSEQGREEDFLVTGSIGNGNIARVPWVAVFNKQVTKTAQDGYYIVLLFSEDMSACYLSLNQGFKAIENQYSRKLALAKVKAAAARSHLYFTRDPYAQEGPINLAATGDLGEGYEQGAIESYRYERTKLPSEVDFSEHFFSLLNHYDKLVSVVNNSLQILVQVNEAEYQKFALEKAVLPEFSKTYVEPTEGVPVPEKSVLNKSAWVRDVKVAALALRQAEFKCAVDPNHMTFISSAKGMPYVEAHHLIPMSIQSKFSYSLDVPANVIALCASCHRLLHHGRANDKRVHLTKLLADRASRLSAMKILPDKKILMGAYSKDLLEDE
ncbi:DUF3578 domain-containing protein [Massilia sp. CCM 8734]|uniref:MrcB family domain-containing protein n=1 Tax=Massilia sp. CCM 8734 TaxID=2609283 RepID=UPI001422ECFC|nr:DUF3578 domain-containing protein [Massilia sp. CCM 8734]NHZ94873.1 DUF3578 domain-containing protein [Massilia sp. CCM 8734]